MNQKTLEVSVSPVVFDYFESRIKNGTIKPKKKHTEYSEFKSNGQRKASRAESINSYEQYVQIEDYFREQKQYRNLLLFQLGIGFGLRFSDLSQLKWKNLFNNDGTFRQRIKCYEQKTGKYQQCLITEAIKEAICQYIADTDCVINSEDYLFVSKTKGKNAATPITVSQAYRIFTKVQKDLNLDFHFSTHTLRKSCFNIAACYSNRQIDTDTLTMIQMMANHSDITTTMRYMGKIEEMLDYVRTVVSDFMQGKFKGELKYEVIK